MLAINVWTAKDAVMISYRDEWGDLCYRRAPREYAAFVRKLPANVWGDQRVVGVRKDGEFHRVLLRDYDARKEWVALHPDALEGDVSPARRILADWDIEIQRPRRCYLDIETDSRVTVADAVEGHARVLSWAVVSETGDERQGCLEAEDDASEYALLQALWAVIGEFDQVSSWNGDEFDQPVIEERSRKYRVWPDRRLLWIDQMVAFKRMNLQTAASGEEKQSFALGAIGEATVGEGKHEFDTSRTYEAWKAGGESRAAMLRYNMQDARLLRKIENKTRFLEAHLAICQICNIPQDSRALGQNAQMDGYFLRTARVEGTRMPTKIDREVVKELPGAFVMAPTKRGILKNVSVLDYSSLYPSIIQTFNLSFDTKYVEGKPFCTTPTTGYRSRTDFRGMVPRAMDRFIAERSIWKKKKDQAIPGSDEWREADRMQNAWKVLANGTYGCQASKHSRLYDFEIALAITQTGAWCVKLTMEEAGKVNIITIYGDTDGSYHQGEGVDAFYRRLNADILTSRVLALGSKQNHLKVEFQEVFERIIFPLSDDNEPAAKRYAGRFAMYKGRKLTESDGVIVEIKGLEFKRGDSTRLARQMQKEVVDLLMIGEEDPEVFEKTTLRWREFIMEGEVPVADIAKSKGVKELAAYKIRRRKDGTAILPAHVVVAEILRERGENPFRVQYVVTDSSTSPQTVVPLSDFDGTFDRHAVWRSTYSPTLRLLAGAFDSRNWHRWTGKRASKKDRPLKGQMSLL